MEIRSTGGWTAANTALSAGHREESAAVSSPEASTAAASAASGPGFITPVIRVEASVGVAVLQVRDSHTGEVELQIPSEKVVAQYASHVISESPSSHRGGQETAESGRNNAHDQGTAETGQDMAPARATAPAGN